MQDPNSPTGPRFLTLLRERLPTGLAGAAAWLGLWFCVLFVRRWISGGFGTFLGVLQFFVGIALVCVAIPLTWQMVRKHLLWSLRNKLVLTYLLIGLAPVVLFLTLVAVLAYVAAGQFAIHLTDSRLQAELVQMRNESGHRADLTTALVAGRPKDSAQQIGSEIQDIEQAGEVARLEIPRIRAHRELRVFMNGAQLDLGPKYRGKAPFGLPPWATELPGGEFSGLVLDGHDLYLVAVHQKKWNDGRIFTLMSSLPVDSAFLKLASEGLGQASLLPQRAGRATNEISQENNGATPATTKKSNQKVRFAVGADGINGGSTWVVGGAEPPAVNFADARVSFTSTEPIIEWDSGERDNILIAVSSRPSLLYNQLFGSSLGGIVTSVLRIAIILLCVVFALIELLALWMAIGLSRSITSSVADLYSATEHIEDGDLDYRIGVKSDDQLAELSRSFNTMSGSLKRLLEEQKEKERLQNEISIAQEVQANLFPLHSQGLETLDLHGVCRPARSVSGDYYDFLVFHEEAHSGMMSRRETGVGIAIGDISGKGISAALLMATLHSAVRAYRFASEELVYSESSVAGLMASREGRGGDCDELFQSPGRILSLLNRHLYRSTQPEKYATLFLAHYDVATAMMTYSNAGQLPPLVLGRDGHIRRLDKGGTVVGLMDGMHYEEDRFRMQPGDIMVAYSDGVTEPENDFGEFGEERMMEVVARYRDQPLHVISGQVMLALDAWIGAEEQPDDITLVLARKT
ncbi:PP2C family protein-serine/threonine phosphatase [Tunturiibacter gelidoferens]|uniref:Sigma-B regulation protein RsbU (Phosphoserine phosphatase) n=3 Tax=Tunturiibacter TaxID=3154218 RepID=A0A7Y9NNZ0_9BACT|nr:SpoIIE family protein phosphatase [Edaphobacter lichenicola]MBB5337886.1 sigma-B regulation protein RsbU (phosphoserine phosphatase) [Edaphobacter lichenicola]NYF52885.1 sigma-B regulation protein RsbU (phosphoserine phosphatase) [Edaphobacter lichenicola]